jgi:hypothetical protein
MLYYELFSQRSTKKYEFQQDLKYLREYCVILWRLNGAGTGVLYDVVDTKNGFGPLAPKLYGPLFKIK